MLGVIKKREGRLKGPTPLPQFGAILSEEVYSCEIITWNFFGAIKQKKWKPIKICRVTADLNQVAGDY